MKFFRNLAAVGVAGALSLAPVLGRGEALRFADSLPPDHLFTQVAAKPWMDEVTKLTNGQITFEHYPAEQLGKAKDMLSIAQSGVADIAFVVPTYITDKLPLSGVVDLPGNFVSSCDGMRAYWKLAHEGLIAQQEMAPNGIRVLFPIVQPPFQVFTTRKKIDAISDFQGLKLRTTGGAMDMMLRDLGGSPVRLAAPDTYEAMSRGTIDGGVLAVVSIASYKLTPLLKFGTTGENFGSAALDYAISETRWKHLPPSVQQAMLKASDDVMLSACGKIDGDNEAQITAMKNAGIVFSALPRDEHDKLAAKLAAVGTDWADGLDKRGKPGAAVLAVFLGALHESQ
jgi:TRAP-type C4-dicarboxylate transport system substrate-binding protein